MKCFGMILVWVLGVQIASAHVCNKVKSIKEVYVTTLFENAIINGKPIDYHVFRSRCDLYCLFNAFNERNLEYTLSANNISVYNKSSVATLTIESIKEGVVSGYLTCSTQAKRAYIALPVKYNLQKVVMDLQTEDDGIISRSLTFSGYSISEYHYLKNEITQQSNKVVFEVGFSRYDVVKNGKPLTVRLSALDKSGGFMLIVETKK